MKIIRYKYLSAKTETEEILIDKEFRCPESSLEANVEVAKSEAYNGEYEIIDDCVEEIPAPTELDILDARLTYVEMMSGILEV